MYRARRNALLLTPPPFEFIQQFYLSPTLFSHRVHANQVMGTIQFATALHGAASLLQEAGFTDVLVPQAKPLSPGETLGCTAPRLYDDNRAKNAAAGAAVGDGAASVTFSSSQQQQLVPRQGVLVFVADGRFHLEAAMIANPQLDAYR